jgi:Tfx family DNA-binding protein
MADLPADVSGTFLTERQAEVLALRNDGLTQREIADRLGTSVANVSGVESSARRNVAAAERTLDLARLLECSVRFRVEGGRDLRELVDEVYARGDDADLRIAHAEPELTTRLHDLLGDRIEERRLVEAVEVGITGEGRVLAFPRGAERDGGG